jgi:probable rRNA maturation factor
MPGMKSKQSVYFHFMRKGFSLNSRNSLKAFIVRLVKSEGKKLADLGYIFCDDDELLAMNRKFLKHNFYTDILSFDLSDDPDSVSGEIYISIDRVRENAKKYDRSFANELHRVIFHGALHLCGYEDKSRKGIAIMREKEDLNLQLYFGK